MGVFEVVAIVLSSLGGGLAPFGNFGLGVLFPKAEELLEVLTANGEFGLEELLNLFVILASLRKNIYFKNLFINI